MRCLHPSRCGFPATDNKFGYCDRHAEQARGKTFEQILKAYVAQTHAPAELVEMALGSCAPKNRYAWAETVTIHGEQWVRRDEAEDNFDSFIEGQAEAKYEGQALGSGPKEAIHQGVMLARNALVLHVTGQRNEDYEQMLALLNKLLFTLEKEL